MYTVNKYLTISDMSGIERPFCRFNYIIDRNITDNNL